MAASGQPLQHIFCGNFWSTIATHFLGLLLQEEAGGECIISIGREKGLCAIGKYNMKVNIA